jgi:hypothetical protein
MSIRFPDITRARFDSELAKKSDWTPQLIPMGQTFLVPADKQLLFAEEIDVEGDLVIDGDLVEVS